MNDKNEEVVYLVEDDLDTLRALRWCCEEAGYRVVCFYSAEAFLEAAPYDRPGCAVIDIRLSGGITGIALQSELERREIDIPTIVISGYADVRTAVDCMRLGATTLLEKPVSPDDFLAAVKHAIEKDVASRIVSEHVQNLQSSLNQLTAREREVLESLLEGKLNKQIALDLDVSQRTIEVDRSRILKKFNVSNAAALAVKATELRLLKGLSVRTDSCHDAPSRSTLALLQGAAEQN